MSPAATVLLVEDDGDVRTAIARGLGLHDMRVVEAGSAEDALTLIAKGLPDVFVVDVGLPGMSGIQLCAELRDRRVDLPILILSAREQVGDRVEGLRAGADDYVVKPFHLDEVAARLEALLRRAARPNGGPDDTVTAGDLWMDRERRTCKIGTSRLELSRREFDLLAALGANAGIVLPRVRLLELVWGYDFDVDTNVVDVFVGYLRRKLAAADGGSAVRIETVRGVGFVLRTS